MKWLVRGVVALVVIVILAVGAGAAMLATFDPNDYKDKISSAVRTATGRELAFGGDIKAVFFPVLGFEAAGLTLGNPDGFADKEFLSVQDVAAGVKIMPLFERRIELTTIKLTGPQITVIKKSDGHTNLELPKRPDAGAAQAEKETPDAPMAVSAEGVEITNAKITYKDLQTGKTTTINPLNLKMPGIAAGREVPVSFDMVMAGAGGETKIAADGRMKPEPDSGKFTFTGLKSTIETVADKLSLNADIAIDTRAQKIAVDNLRAEGNGTSLTGRAALNGFESPDVTFDISSPTVDLDALMPKQPETAANDNKQLLPLDIIRQMKLDGNIAIGALKMSGLAMNDLKIAVKGGNGVITADPVTASVYDGALNTAVKIDARSDAPAFSLAGALKNLQAGKLIEAKMGQDYVTGLANVDFDLSSRGNTMAALKSASGGRFAFNFGEGYINKWQLSRLINQAIAFFETGSISQDVGDRIHFTSLDGSFTGSNGVFSNNDLQLLAPKSHALGSGTVSLRDQNVNYTLRVGLGEDPAKFADKKHLPILISGPLSAPQYSLDFQSIVREEAQKQIEEKGQELLNKALGGKSTGGAATDKTNAIDPAAAGEMVKGLFGGH